MELHGRVTLIKSGSDFEEFSDLTVNLDGSVKRERVVITTKFQADLQIQETVNKYTNELQ